MTLAATARAAVMKFVLDPTASSLSFAGSSLDLTALSGGIQPYTAQPDRSSSSANGLVSRFAGHLYVDVQPGSIRPLADDGNGNPTSQKAIGSAPAPTGNDYNGAFIPNLDQNGQPCGTCPNPNFGNASADWGNYGVQIPAVGLFARIWNLSIGPTGVWGADGAMPFVGSNTYAVAPQIWGYLGGKEALVSALGSTLTTFTAATPFVLPLSGTLDLRTTPVFTPGSGTATWDGTTLTINVNGTVWWRVSASPPIIDDKRVLSGALVYHPCIDGIIQPGETCDDGNTTAGDGCSATCTTEPGYACTGTPSVCAPKCGDGTIIAPETCDDGNTTAGDGCSATCAIEPGYACTGTPSVCAPTSSPTTDVPLDGKEVRIYDIGPPRGHRNAVSLFDADVALSGLDPTVTGATVEIGRIGGGAPTVFTLPAEGWRGSGDVTRIDFKYKNRSGDRRTARLLEGRSIRFTACGEGVYPLGGVPQEQLGVVVTVGDVRFCGLFGGTISRDDGNRFVAQLATAPAACPDFGATTTTSSTTTSSTTTTTLFSGCFKDIGDGTIYDTCTGLQWEKKTNTAGLQNVNARYTWAGCCNGDCSATANYTASRTQRRRPPARRRRPAGRWGAAATAV